MSEQLAPQTPENEPKKGSFTRLKETFLKKWDVWSGAAADREQQENDRVRIAEITSSIDEYAQDLTPVEEPTKLIYTRVDQHINTIFGAFLNFADINTIQRLEVKPFSKPSRSVYGSHIEDPIRMTECSYGLTLQAICEDNNTVSHTFDFGSTIGPYSSGNIRTDSNAVRTLYTATSLLTDAKQRAVAAGSDMQTVLAFETAEPLDAEKFQTVLSELDGTVKPWDLDHELYTDLEL